MDPEIIYEDKNFLAINKPAGLLVHAARTNADSILRGSASSRRKSAVPEGTLVDWLLKHFPEVRGVGDDPATRPGIVHRLDKDASGVMLVARNQKSFEYLKNLFKNHLIKKIYLAVVFGKLTPRSGKIEKAIGIKNGTLRRSVHSEKMSKDALTEYSVKKYFEVDSVSGRSEYFSLAEVYPKTGRTHQIRVHLASIGHPILGDKLYGPKRQPVWAERLMLHALSLEFTTAEGRRLKLEASPPHQFLELLGEDAHF